MNSANSHLSLAAGAEFDLIRRIWRRLGDRHAPSGGDCAMLELGSERLAVTVDASIEGTHFRLGWISHREVGWRACTATLSDLAAVAAEPVGVMVCLGVPSEWPAELASDVMEGVGEAASAVGAAVLGGDLVRSDRLIVDVVGLGRAPRAVSRAGAEVGDFLWVTGELGGPAAALAAWNAGIEPEGSARARFALPEARVREAAWLRDRGAKALIDISDGLLADASHLAAASAVGLEIEYDRVPTHPAAEPEVAITSGEEYELLVALPATFGREDAAAFRETFGVSLTRVGDVTVGEGVRLVRNGLSVESPEGYRHF